MPDTVDRTTDGTGAIAEMTLADLDGLDAGSWKDAAYAGEAVPTLEDALALADGRGRSISTSRRRVRPRRS